MKVLVYGDGVTPFTQIRKNSLKKELSGLIKKGYLYFVVANQNEFTTFAQDYLEIVKEFVPEIEIDFIYTDSYDQTAESMFYPSIRSKTRINEAHISALKECDVLLCLLDETLPLGYQELLKQATNKKVINVFKPEYPAETPIFRHLCQT